MISKALMVFKSGFLFYHEVQKEHEGKEEQWVLNFLHVLEEKNFSYLAMGKSESGL